MTGYVDDYIPICEDYFQQRGYVVTKDYSLHDDIRWRYNLCLEHEGVKKLVDIRVTEKMPQIFISAVETTKRLFPDIEIYIAVPSDSRISPQFIVESRSLGLGIYTIDANLLTCVLQPRTAERTEIEQEKRFDPQFFSISPNTPFGNLLAFRRILRQVRTNLLWLDRHFNRKGLERLYEEICNGTITNINEIKILCGPYKNNMKKGLQVDFTKFKAEMMTRGINSDLRVIIDQPTLAQIHDRFIISQNVIFSILPINSLEMNNGGLCSLHQQILHS